MIIRYGNKNNFSSVFRCNTEEYIYWKMYVSIITVGNGPMYVLGTQCCRYKYWNKKYVTISVTNLNLFCSGILNMQCFIGYLKLMRPNLHQHKHSAERANKRSLNCCWLPKHTSHWYQSAKSLRQRKISYICFCIINSANRQNALLYYISIALSQPFKLYKLTEKLSSLCHSRNKPYYCHCKPK